MKVSLHLTIRGTWKLFHVFLPVSYSFHIKIYESCAYDHPQLRSFWLDKVSKYHIDSLAKLIVQMPPLPNSAQFLWLGTWQFLLFSCFHFACQGRVELSKGGFLWLKFHSPLARTYVGRYGWTLPTQRSRFSNLTSFLTRNNFVCCMMLII